MLPLKIIKPTWDLITDIGDRNSSSFEHEWTTFGDLGSAAESFLYLFLMLFPNSVFVFFPVSWAFFKKGRDRVWGESVGETEKQREREKEKGSLWCTPMEFIIRITSVISTFSLRVFFPLSRSCLIFKEMDFTLFMRYLGILCITMFQGCKETTTHKSKHLPSFSEPVSGMQDLECC